MDNYELQPDGRLVAGPPLISPQPKSKRVFHFIITTIWIITMVGSFWFGQSFNNSSLHDQVVDRLQAGCIFQFKGISTTDLGRTELELQAKDAVDVLEKQVGVKNIQTSSIPAEDGLRRMDPTATRLVVVSWEVCQ